MTTSNVKSGGYRVFSQLKPGDRVKVTQTVRVGFRQWTTTVSGTVLETRRCETGLHTDRADDDHVFVDTILLNRDGAGDRTTVTIDENTQIEVVAGG